MAAPTSARPRWTQTKGLALLRSRDWISHIVTFQRHKIPREREERCAKGHGWFFCASTILLRIRLARSASFYIILRTPGMTRTKPQWRSLRTCTNLPHSLFLSSNGPKAKGLTHSPFPISLLRSISFESCTATPADHSWCTPAARP